MSSLRRTMRRSKTFAPPVPPSPKILVMDDLERDVHLYGSATFSSGSVILTREQAALLFPPVK